MPIEKIQRRNNVPFIYARGTHYDVGFDIVSIDFDVLNVFKSTNNTPFQLLIDPTALSTDESVDKS